MITPDYARLMARYNGEMNRRFYAAAGRIGEKARRADRGAFFGSLHGTLNHLMWCDLVWLARLAGAPMPSGTREESAAFIDDFDVLSRRREKTDADIVAWAGTLDAGTLAAPHVWFAGTDREFGTPRGVVVMHMFNHQTHHRGQVHALLTGFGEDTGVTDLWDAARLMSAQESAQ